MAASDAGHAQDTGRQRRYLALGCLTLLAGGLRFFRLTHGGLWYDELIMARVTGGDFASLFQQIYDGRPPLYPILGWLWCGVLGTSDLAMRSLPALLGTLTVPAIFLAARRLFDARVALLSALLLAVSPYQVYYSQEHRYYALTLLLGTLSVWLLLRAMRFERVPSGEAEPPPPRWGWTLYVAASVLMFYAHAMTALLLGSLGIAGLVLGLRGGLGEKGLRRFLVSQVVIVVLTVPWVALPLLAGARAAAAGAADGGEIVSWIVAPPWWGGVRTYINFLVLGLRYVPAWAMAGAAGLLVVGAVLAGRRLRALGGVPAASPSLSGGVRALPGAGWWVVGWWALGPVVAALAVSWWIKPVYVDRYVICAAGGWYIALAAFTVALSRSLGRGVAVAGVAAALLVMAGALGRYYMDPQKGAWPQAAAWLDARLTSDDALAFASESGGAVESPHVRANWFWYARVGRDAPQIEVDVRRPVAEVAADLAALCHGAAAGAGDASGETSRFAEPQQRREETSGSRGGSESEGNSGVDSEVDSGGGVWLVMWRDTENPVGLGDAFADGPVGGMELTQIQRFYDLTLIRFAPRGAATGPTGTHRAQGVERRGWVDGPTSGSAPAGR